MKQFSKWAARHPYFITSTLFLALIVFGFIYLSWRKDDFMFLLLLYFIVTLGIRLDDIARQIGHGRETPPDAEDNVLAALHEMRGLLRETNFRLKAIQNSLNQGPDD